MKLGSTVRTTNSILIRLGGVLIFVAMLLTTGDAILRKFFSSPIPGALEICEELLVGLVFFGLAFTQFQDGHINVDLVYERLSLKGQRLTRVFSLTASLIAIGFLTASIFAEAFNSLQTQEISFGLIPIPLWPAKMAAAVGLLMLWICLIDQLLAVIRHKKT